MLRCSLLCFVQLYIWSWLLRGRISYSTSVWQSQVTQATICFCLFLFCSHPVFWPPYLTGPFKLELLFVNIHGAYYEDCMKAQDLKITSPNFKNLKIAYFVNFQDQFYFAYKRQKLAITSSQSLLQWWHRELLFEVSQVKWNPHFCSRNTCISQPSNGTHFTTHL